MIQHVLRPQNFDLEDMRRFFDNADKIEGMLRSGTAGTLLAGHYAVNLFAAPSTRTRTSFRLAEIASGMHILADETDVEHATSWAKGESVPDMIKTYEGIVSVVADPSKLMIVIRHPKAGVAEEIADATHGSHVFNAGCGKSDGYHPTQAFQDARLCFAHGRSLGLVSLDTLGEQGLAGLNSSRKKFKVLAFGDLRNGRTIRSLAYLLAKCFPWVEFYFASPPSLKMGQDILDHLDEHSIPYHITVDPEEFVSWLRLVHLCYATRFQFEDLDFEDRRKFDEYQNQFLLDLPRVQTMRPDAFILHPFPRNRELSRTVDADPRALYLREQIPSGPTSRLTLMTMVFGIM
ncbi:MAG: hypothetical protein WC508_05190 [Patescibacteria group bacterium]